MAETTPKLTMRQKLTAIHIRDYMGAEWVPEAGDYFTTIRADLVLYKITKIIGRRVFVICLHGDPVESEYDLGIFTSGAAGSMRVHVPKFVLENND